MKTPV